MTRRPKHKKHKKGSRYHDARLGGQRGAIPGAVRVYSKARAPQPKMDWSYSNGTGRCGACGKQFLEGDMIKRNSNPRRHYICFKDTDGGGKQ